MGNDKNNEQANNPNSREDNDGRNDRQYDDVDICHAVLICLLVASVVVALSFSIVTLASCNFMKVIKLPPSNETGFDNMTGYPPSTENVTFGTFGLLYYNPGGLGCRAYPRTTPLNTWYSTARFGGMVAAGAGVAAVGVLAIELVCCRFICSRVVLLMLLVAALIAQALTFLMYTTELCFQENDITYPCLFDQGSTFSVIALGVFLFAALLACPTPKPKPMIRALMERERRTDNSDPCCYCWSKKKPEDDRKKTDETNVEAPPQQPADPQQPPIQQQPGPQALYPVPVPPGGPPPYYPQPQPQYPDEVYAVNYTNTYNPMSSSMIAGPMPDPDNDTISVPLSRTASPYIPPPPQEIPSSSRSVPPQYHYFAPAQPPQSSFINAEVIEDDLFFDSKTVG